MKRIRWLAVFIIAGCQSAEPPAPEPAPLRVTFDWKPADGDVWTLRVESVRHTEIQTGKEPIQTRFTVRLYGELLFGAPAADGSRACVFTFATLEGTIDALGVTMPLTDKPSDIAGRTVAAAIDARGCISWDKVALRTMVEGLDLNEDLQGIFPELPRGSVGPQEPWSVQVDRHTDTYEIKSIDRDGGSTVARFGGMSKADESRGTDELGSSLKVAGTLAGEWDVDAGGLTSFRESRVEDAKLVTKKSTLRTHSELKRDVTLAKKK